jgi:hypothetical protein
MQNSDRDSFSTPSDLSIVIKTTLRDLPNFVELQDDLVHHGFSQVLVSVPSTHAREFAAKMHRRFTLTTDEEVLDAFNYREHLVDSWYSQQLLKLLLVQLVGADKSWVLDANQLLLRIPDDLITTKPIPLECEEVLPEDYQWAQQSASFLGVAYDNQKVIRLMNQLFRSSVVTQMLDHIAHRYQDDPIRTLAGALRRGVRNDFPEWTESGLYGAFTAHLGAASGHLFQKSRTRIAFYRETIEGLDICGWLERLRTSPPYAVKVYGRRHDYHLSPDQVRRRCAQIRAALE